MGDDDQKRPVLSVVGDDEEELVQRGERIGAEVGAFGLFENLDWEEHPSGYAVWARLMQRYLAEFRSRLSLSYLDVVMWRWKKIYRRQAARFLEMRAAKEHEEESRIAPLLLFYAACIAQGRDLDANGDFIDRAGYRIGDCPTCQKPINMRYFTGRFMPTKPGDRFKHGNAIYECRGCGAEVISRRILPPNRHLPNKHK